MKINISFHDRYLRPDKTLGDKFMDVKKIKSMYYIEFGITTKQFPDKITNSFFIFWFCGHLFIKFSKESI